jgi:hypothetical protein
MGLSDRIIAMADGTVIASGTPDIVRNDSAVVEAYLGGSVAAIERSGITASPTPPPEPPHEPSYEPPPGNGSGPYPERFDDLELVPGLTAARRTALLDAFGTIDAVRDATEDEIASVPGLGRATARRVLEALR